MRPIVVVSIVVLLIACSESSTNEGAVCLSDSDCDRGLQCAQLCDEPGICVPARAEPAVVMCRDQDADGAWEGCECSPSLAVDCDDESADVHPSAAEACDDFDNDCDGIVDEGCIE